MVEQARAKLMAAGLEGRFLVCDAAQPRTGDEQFDVLLSRHLVWTLPDPQAALREWVSRIRPGGTLILVEGRWRHAGQSGMPYVAGAEMLPWHQGISADDLPAAVGPQTEQHDPAATRTLALRAAWNRLRRSHPRLAIRLQAGAQPRFRARQTSSQG